MLKVQLSAAWYHVVQADRLDGILHTIQRCQPDLILTAMQLTDGTALDLKQAMVRDPQLARIPVVAIAAQNDHDSQLRALRAGIDDVLNQPVDDIILLARIRRLLLARSQLDDLGLDPGAPMVAGLAEASAGFTPAQRDLRIALMTQAPSTGPVWRARLKPVLPHRIECYQMSNMQALMTQAPPDAVVLELPGSDHASGFRLLSDLHARGTTRDAVILAIPEPANAALAAEALDRGAHDALAQGFCPEELTLRLHAQLQRKAEDDKMRHSVRSGLNAAMRDPMTGLFNRGYALPHMAKQAQEAARTGRDFALLMIDLDHFKQVNDRYGHRSGDAVLIESAQRMQDLLPAGSLFARVGGEEFLAAIPGASAEQAVRLAGTLCEIVNTRPFRVPGAKQPIRVTTSIGIAVTPRKTLRAEDCLSDIMDRADRALYAAKESGRNTVTLARQAA